MGFEMKEIAQESRRADGDEFVTLVREVKHLLKKEKESRGGGLSRLPNKGTAAVVGDLHGDVESLEFILSRCEQDYIVFLGDYGDRGSDSPEVFYTLLRLKRDHPENIILLRGNHEPPADLPVSPHNLPRLLEEKFQNGREIYSELSDLFQHLPYAAVAEGSYLFLHGGLPEVSSLEEIQLAEETHPEKPYLEQILWSDPMEGNGTAPSLRGAGRMFGKDVSQQILDSLGVKTLIRSHQPCEGVRVDHNGKVVTVFSNKIYGNLKVAFLVIDLSTAKDGYELEKEAIEF